MRSFVALPLPDPVADRVALLQDQCPVGRPTPPENLHLTLAFLDDVPPETLAELNDRLTAIRIARFDLDLIGLDLFGGARSQILLANPRHSPMLETLHSQVSGAARLAGLALPRRRFRPHVTLVRFNRPPRGVEAQRLAAFLHDHGLLTGISWTVDRFALYRSDLGRGPAVHSELASYDLG